MCFAVLLLGMIMGGTAYLKWMYHHNADLVDIEEECRDADKKFVAMTASCPEFVF